LLTHAVRGSRLVPPPEDASFHQLCGNCHLPEQQLQDCCHALIAIVAQCFCGRSVAAPAADHDRATHRVCRSVQGLDDLCRKRSARRFVARHQPGPFCARSSNRLRRIAFAITRDCVQWQESPSAATIVTLSTVTADRRVLTMGSHRFDNAPTVFGVACRPIRPWRVVFTRTLWLFATTVAES
jgi:hypothetical protein